MDTKYFSLDTIIAPATPLQAGAALGIIRLSGNNALSAALQVIKTKLQAAPESHRLYLADFFSSEGALIDKGLFVWMKGPNSFTGEDVVEFHLHGNPLILQEVITSVLSKGIARMAEAGEFSFRAFRNGKLDLAQAESIGTLIAAKSVVSVGAAARALEGSTSSVVGKLRDRLVNLLAQVELDIDFSDQGVPQLDFSRLEAGILDLSNEMLRLHEQFLKSRPARDGINVAIVGAPNSGKSTLFNQILKMDRSIVSEIAGTTRDVVRESIHYSGLLFVFADTAGLRDTADIIEQRGIERSFLTVESADIVLLVVDVASAKGPNIAEILELHESILRRRSGVPVFLCLNKADSVGPEIIAPAAEKLSSLGPMPISALTGDGIEALMDGMSKLFSATISGDDNASIWHMRHGVALKESESILKSLHSKLLCGLREPDLISIDLRAGLDRLGEITGEFSSDDMLNHIFTKFCIGK